MYGAHARLFSVSNPMYVTVCIQINRVYLIEKERCTYTSSQCRMGQKSRPVGIS